MFKIISVTKSSYDQDHVRVYVSMDVKDWNKARKQSLGQLYGIDISNEVYREHGVAASNPTVDDRRKARNGIKYLTLTYNDSAWEMPCDQCSRDKTCPNCDPNCELKMCIRDR